MTHRRAVLEAAGALLLTPLLPARLLSRRTSSIRRQRVRLSDAAPSRRCCRSARRQFWQERRYSIAYRASDCPHPRATRKNAAELPVTLRGRSWSWHRTIGRADPTLDAAPTRPGSTFLGGEESPWDIACDALTFFSMRIGFGAAA